MPGGKQYTTDTQSLPIPYYDNIVLNGGLNSTAGPLELADNESSSLQNIDLDKFGSILKRSGYTVLNSTPISSATTCDGLWWFEYMSSGAYASKAINVTGGKIYSMAGLGGTWVDFTGALTITANNHCDFENWNNQLFVTNGHDKPITWVGTGTATNMPVFNGNSYSFKVIGITTAPAIGDTYTNNTITYTITGVYLTGTSGSIGGTLTVTGTGAPQVAGNLARATGAGDASIAFTIYYVNANITSAKFVKQYNNYLFWGNVVESSITYQTRIYWSEIINPNIVQGSSWIEVGLNDGQQITGLRVLQDRLVVYKTRSIYNLFFTGDSDIPFIMPGGGKSNSSVGCIAPFSIQEAQNGHVFLAADGIYYYDGMNSTKLSQKITATLFGSADVTGMNNTLLYNAVSTVYKSKNRYLLAVASSGETQHDTIIVWDYFNNAFSLYSGMAASALCAFFVSSTQEYIYFSDYAGYTYLTDTGANDYPLNVKTAINAYYYTNWRVYKDLCDQKGIPDIYIYFEMANSVLVIAYSYEFESTDQYTYTISTGSGSAVYGSAIWDQSVYGGAGGNVNRIDLTGRGRVIRFKFANSAFDETFRIDGFGTLIYHETSV